MSVKGDSRLLIEMPGVGRQRDRMIAEMKGLCWHILDPETIWAGYGSMSASCTKCGERILGSALSHDRKGRRSNKEREELAKQGEGGLAPHWSTDTSAAWELWDELPLESAVCYLHYPDSYIGYPEVHVIDFWSGSNHLKVSGTSFADAVSKAWIAWKKSL